MRPAVVQPGTDDTVVHAKLGDFTGSALGVQEELFQLGDWGEPLAANATSLRLLLAMVGTSLIWRQWRGPRTPP